MFLFECITVAKIFEIYASNTANQKTKICANYLFARRNFRVFTDDVNKC